MTTSDGFGLVAALAAGVGLAAASGFRVFVPLLGMSLAIRFGQFQPGGGFDWLASPIATLVLGIAVVAEVGAYLVPWLDNALDTIATPAAVIAGTLLTALMLGDVSPMAQWILAIVAGGGTAGAVQVGTVAARATTLATTGGVANPIVSTGEALLSVLFTVLSVIVPIVAVALLLLFVGWWLRRRSGPRDVAAGA